MGQDKGKIPMISLAACGYFRDSMLWYGVEINQVSRFFGQLHQQERSLYSKGILERPIEIVTLESGSKDHTESTIRQIIDDRPNTTLIKQGKAYCKNEVASTGEEERFKPLATIGNIVLETAKCLDTDYIFWTESDIIIDNPYLLANLVEKMEEDNSISILAPIIYIGNWFYDTWGYKSIDNSCWTNEFPYNHMFLNGERYIDMLSIGSTCLMRTNHMKNINFGDNCFLSLCESVINNSGRIVLDKELYVQHPSENGHVKGRWI